MDTKIVIDGFIDDFEALREHCDSISYDGGVNETDGVFYPGTTLEIPESVKQEIISKLENGIGKKISCSTMFLRLSVEGVKAPHQAHTDTSMGQYGFMLYLNRLEDCLGGTSFVRHKESGLSHHPINQKQADIWKRDHSITDAWSVTDMFEMLPNRACVFNTDIMHRSEPVGGFGKDAKDGRLVLICFFDVIGND